MSSRKLLKITEEALDMKPLQSCFIISMAAFKTAGNFEVNHLLFFNNPGYGPGGSSKSADMSNTEPERAEGQGLMADRFVKTPCLQPAPATAAPSPVSQPHSSRILRPVTGHHISSLRVLKAKDSLTLSLASSISQKNRSHPQVSGYRGRGFSP